ncbi:hypothetical protein HanIR_Chr17g0863751 [Helianthus annuus]|nr:hypothetical protein HanIR_Chr17g0863751 [Helianthus annuus]
MEIKKGNHANHVETKKVARNNHADGGSGSVPINVGGSAEDESAAPMVTESPAVHGSRVDAGREDHRNLENPGIPEVVGQSPSDGVFEKASVNERYVLEPDLRGKAMGCTLTSRVLTMTWHVKRHCKPLPSYVKGC